MVSNICPFFLVSLQELVKGKYIDILQLEVSRDFAR